MTSVTSRYAKIRSMHIEHFMGIEDSTITFDDDFVNLKGMNSRGKSATIKAFRVLMTNYKANKQKVWIQWGYTYFRLTLTLDNDISIQYGKMSNGHSYYEIIDSDDNIMFTTRLDGVYAPIVEVPEPVRRLLGMVQNKQITPNFLKSREPLFIVDTTGKTNYEFLNTVLESPDVSKAQELVQADISDTRSELKDLASGVRVRQDILTESPYIDKVVLDELEEQDNNLERSTTIRDSLSDLRNTHNSFTALQFIPDLPSINNTLLSGLENLRELAIEHTLLVDLPTINGINTDKLQTLQSLSRLSQDYHALQEVPELTPVDANKDLLKQLTVLSDLHAQYHQLKAVETLPTMPDSSKSSLYYLSKLSAYWGTYQEIEDEIQANQATVDESLAQLDNIQVTIQNMGYHAYRCSECGHLDVYDDSDNPLTVKIEG